MRFRHVTLGIAMAVVSLPWSDASADPTYLTDGRAAGAFGESVRASGSADSKTGAMRYSYAFEVPTPRGAVTSTLSLTYDSSSRDGEAGYGWGLDLPVIERRPMSGRPRFFNPPTRSDERFYFDGQPLVEICTVGACSGSAPLPSWASGWRYYRLQVEGLFARFFLAPSGKQWRVQLKGGEMLEFGSADGATATEYINNTPAHIVRWRLARRADMIHLVAGEPVNVVKYRWERLGNRGLQFLTDIWDTPRGAATAPEVEWAHHVQLTWEDPLLQTSYADAYRATPDRRLKRVAVSSQTWAAAGARETVRFYDLRYADDRGATSYTGGLTAPLWGHSFLKEIQLIGGCSKLEQGGQIPSAIQCRGLPPTKFEYQGKLLGFGSATSSPIDGGVPGMADNYRVFIDPESSAIIDLNRDGLPDVIQSWESGDCYNAAGRTNVHCDQSTCNPDADFSLWCMRPTMTPSDPEQCPPQVLTPPAFYQGIRSARPMLGYVNRRQFDGVTYRLQHNCIDAGAPPAPPGGSNGLTVARVNGPGPAKFFTSQGAATLLGPWSNANVLWEASSDVADGFSPWYAKPLLGGGAGANCDLQSFDATTFNPGWRWTIGHTLDWSLPARTTFAPNAGNWYADVDGDGLVDEIGETSGSPWLEFWPATVAFTQRIAKGEVIPPVSAVADSPKQKPFVYDANLNSSSFVPGRCRWRSKFFYTDVNGDGLVDLVVTNSDTDGGIPRVRPGNGTGSFECNILKQSWACAPPFWPNDNPAAYVIDVPGAVKPWPFTADTFFHDMTGDGLADIVQYNPTTGRVRLWVNQDGRTFACSNFQNADPCDIGVIIDTLHATTDLGPHRISFADMNADGSDDMVVVARVGAFVASAYSNAASADDARAHHAGVLIKIDNGLGATTKIRYSTIQELDVQAAAANDPWLYHSPAVEPVVTQIKTQDTTGAQGGTINPPYAVNRLVQYSYRDPAYDRWTRAFAGFRKVRETTGQEAGITETTYWFGPCQNYRFDAVDASDNPEYRCRETSDDELYKARTGLPVRVDRYQAAYLPQGVPERRLWSRIVKGYDTGNIVGLDRTVRWALPDHVETYIFDAALPATAGPGPAPSLTGGGDPNDDQPAYQDTRKTIVERFDYDGFGNLVAHWDDGLTATGNSPAVDTATLTLLTSVADPNATNGPSTGYTIDCNADWQCNPGFITVYGRSSPTSLWEAVRKSRLTYQQPATNGGDVVLVEGFLTNTFALQRQNGGNPIALPPPDPLFGWRQLARYSYDAFGNVRTAEVAPGSRNPPCTTIDYDEAFNDLPHHIHAFKEGCGSSGLHTTTIFDRGFEQPVLQVAPSGAVSQQALDELGRPKQIWAPAPDQAVGDTTLSATIEYHDAAPLSVIDVVPSAGPRHVAVLNGVGEHVLTLHRGDLVFYNEWIVQGWRETNYAGQVQRTRRPFRFYGDPLTAALSAQALSPPSNGAFDLYYDGVFGRYQATHEITGPGTSVLVEHVTHRPLEAETRDAEQINASSPHYGAYALTRFDGHGRAWFHESHVASGASPATQIDFLPTGEPVNVKRGSNGVTVYTRQMSYDTFGRLQRNQEPNTSKTDPLGNREWTYTWDDAGRLVGTSDARGCGKNIFYDGLGRVQGEDYSPCSPSHPPYSLPNLATGAGLEVSNVYDAYEIDQVESDATFSDQSGLAIGQLIATKDRGSYTRFNYDNRGRVRRVSRRPTRPAAFVGPGDARYVTTWLKSRVDYDAANRVTRQTSGAASNAFLVNGTSEVTYAYSPRGFLQSVLGSYGGLATYSRTPSGAIDTINYGDPAGSFLQTTYDARDRVARHKLERSFVPSIWQTTFAGYTYANGYGPSSGNDAHTTNMKPFDWQVTSYDDAGNPLRMDHSAGFPGFGSYANGNAVISARTASFDDLYRVTRTDQDYYTYTKDSVWTTPYALERSIGDRHPIPLAAGSRRVRQQTFAYDALGNVTSTSDNRNLYYDRSLGPVTYNAAAANQMDAATTVDVSHDASGNMTELKLARNGTCSDGLASRCAQWMMYEWDEVGQLERAKRWDFVGNALPPSAPTDTPIWDIRFAYSGGARVLKSASEGGTAPENTVDVFSTFRYTQARYDDAAQDYENDPDKQDVYLGGVAHIVHDGPRVMPQAEGSMGPLHTFLLVPDMLGSTAAVIDRGSSELVEWTTYYPHGATENDFRNARWAQFREPLKFTGKEEDIEIGLTYFGARYYAPYLGQWASADPLTVHALGSDLNPYAYVGGRVSKFVDPFGLQAVVTEEVNVRGPPRGSLQRKMELDAARGSATWPDIVLEVVKKQTALAIYENGQKNYRNIKSPKATKKGFIKGAAKHHIKKLQTMFCIFCPQIGIHPSDRITTNPSDPATEVGEDADEAWFEVATVVATLGLSRGVSPARLAPAVDTAGGGALSRTVPDVVYHYTTAENAAKIQQTGLWAQSSSTDVGTYSAQQAVELLGVKTPPNVVIEFQNGGRFILNRPPIVQPHPLGPGGGLDITNPARVPSQCILCVRPVQ